MVGNKTNSEKNRLIHILVFMYDVLYSNECNHQNDTDKQTISTFVIYLLLRENDGRCSFKTIKPLVLDFMNIWNAFFHTTPKTQSCVIAQNGHFQQ